MSQKILENKGLSFEKVDLSASAQAKDLAVKYGIKSAGTIVHRETGKIIEAKAI